MIIVPIIENKTGLATATDAKFRAPDYSGSGLEALGAGLAQLGEGGRQWAGGIAERRRRAAEAIAEAMLDDRHQGNIDDAAVKQAYVDYSDLAHEALHGDDGLSKLRGAEAHTAFPALVGKLADHHDKALARLDEVQREVLAPMLGARLRNDVARAAAHVREQGKAEQHAQAEKLQLAAARDAVANFGDPELHDHHMATGENAIRQQGRIMKLSDKEVGRQVADYQSAVHAGTIEALIPHDPVHAAGWHARYGDKLNDFDKQRVEATLGPALADARAMTDVDAASTDDAATAPANPHAGDDATLLLKMQGITPMMDQTELPALMRRYGNDPAKAWAAFEAGSDAVDRLIAQRGDDWYTGLGDDTRRFVGGNMAMLGVATSTRAVPREPQTTPLQISGQDRGDVRKSAAIADMTRRITATNFERTSATDEMSAAANLFANEGPRLAAYRVVPSPLDAAFSIASHEPGWSFAPAASLGDGADQQGASSPHDPDPEREDLAAKHSLRNWLYDLEPAAVEDGSRLDIGILSRSEESPGAGPATISSGKGDMGGKSYGTYQLARTKNQVPEFLASEGRHWADEFRGLELYGDKFDAKWKEIARREPKAFSAAQAAYIKRVDYDPVVERIFAETHVDLRTRSHGVRNAVLSTGTQMGPGTHGPDDSGAALIMRRAVNETLTSVGPFDADFDRQLIDNIYRNRTLYGQRVIARDLRQSQNPSLSPAKRDEYKKAARNMQNVLDIRYPRERRNAQALLAAEQREDRQ